MRKQVGQYGSVAFCLLLIGVAGCAVDRGKVYVKDGKRYGVTSSRIWRGRWWNYYERGVSYAAGEFWDDAIADFQAAIKQRPQDQRRARRYGMHFIDYFPHRELGVVYYHQGRYPDAIRELQSSLSRVDSAKAKFYLNQARREQLRQSRRDAAPPRIRFDTPADGLLTNRLSIKLTGRVEDDTYVAAVTVGGRALFIELAAPRIPFTREIRLKDGPNAIEVVATDLLGRLSRKRLTVHLDRRGPLLSVDRVEVLGTLPRRRVRVRGLISDRSRVRRFSLAGRAVPVRPETDWEFRQEISLAVDMAFLPFEIEDAAGNITRGRIALTPPAGGPPGIRKGESDIPARRRWAMRRPATVMVDMPPLQAAPLRPVQQRDRFPPTIHLSELAAQQTVYYDTIYLDGDVKDAGTITSFSVNGETLMKRAGRQIFFGQMFPLQEGDNRFVFEAVDMAGNVTRREIVVRRRVPEVRRLDKRLEVAVLPFAHLGEGVGLGETVYDYLLEALVQQRRFHLVERVRLQDVLQEIKLGQTKLVEEKTAARIGKIAAAEGILVGIVKEKPPAFEVLARFVDVETATIMAVEDVYGENLALRDVQNLMRGLAWKLQQRFPIVEGIVIKIEGRRLFVDIGRKQALKTRMKTLIFRDGGVIRHPVTGRELGRDTHEVGEARVEAVFEDFSRATLLRAEPTEDVKLQDRVITK